MKVIDLLNKIANGEDIPVIKWYGKTLIWNSEHKWFDDIDDRAYCKNYFDFEDLNDEVKIIEEEKEIEHYDLVDNYEVMNDKIIANNFEHINEELEWLVREIKKLKEQKNNGYNT